MDRERTRPEQDEGKGVSGGLGGERAGMGGTGRLIGGSGFQDMGGVPDISESRYFTRCRSVRRS
jgi:hypothetical protein